MTDMYWWFSRIGGKLGYEDGRTAAVGERHEVKGEISLCQRGLHASSRAIDALQYATGPVVWRVRLSGKVIHGGDKAVASVREYVAGGVDCSDVLKAAARQFALRVVGGGGEGGGVGGGGVGGGGGGCGDGGGGGRGGARRPKRNPHGTT